jgi:hexosaminidase
MDRQPILLPYPRKLNFSQGVNNLSAEHLIYLDCKHPQSILFSAIQIQNALLNQAGLKYEIYAGTIISNESAGIILRLAPLPGAKSQEYRLQITPTSICIQAPDPHGLFYGCCTFIQLIQYHLAQSRINSGLPPSFIPCLEVEDWPDFKNRGVMIDISRDKVPTMETMYNLINLLSTWKINQLQLYTEHTFAYKLHPDVWANASPFTGEEILRLDKYCRERFIELVPNQNSFGHMERWLKHPRYLSLAEAPDGFDFPWEHHSGPFSLCPIDPASIKLLAGLFDELLPHFSSRQVNVGCDETFDLGQGRSRDACLKYGTSRVYLDFVLKIYKEVSKRSYKMQLWGDMLMVHPDLISKLPKDCLVLEWGYEGNHPFEEHSNKLAQSGLPFYVCPGTSSWNSIAGRTDNCIQNISNASKCGIEYGAEGYLITDWGDSGHWQVLPVSYLGFATGAAYSWSYQANQNLDIAAVLDYYAFQDSSFNIGKIAYNFGNLYHEIGIELENSSLLFEILQQPIKKWNKYLPPEDAFFAINHTLDMIDQIGENLSLFNSARPDKKLVEREFLLTRDLLRHACIRGLFGFGSTSISKESLAQNLKEIIKEYQEIWLSRNRYGGLKDSLVYFNLPLKEYE